MKKFAKLSLTFMVMAVTLITFFAVAPKAQAAETIDITYDKWYVHNSDLSNYKWGCFNKIVVPSRGYVTFTARKPTDANGNIVNLTLNFDKGTGWGWQAVTYPQATNNSDYFVFVVGLDAGTYSSQLNSIENGQEELSVEYKYSFTPTTSYEIEPNNDINEATELSLNKMYTGHLIEDLINMHLKDVFSVKLSSDINYRIKFDGHNNSLGTDVTLEFLDSYGNALQLPSSKKSGTLTYWDIRPQKSGIYYIRIGNTEKKTGEKYKIGVYTKVIDASDLKVSLSGTSYKYDGNKKTPSVVVKYDGVTLKKDVHYTVTYPSSRTNPGLYSVTIKFKNGYTGTKTLKFKITPATVNASKMTAAQTTSSIKLTWPKVTGATGYKVYQYNSSQGKYVQIATVTSNTYKKTTNLKAGTTYKFKVKAYKKLSNGTIIDGVASSEFATATKCAAPKISTITASAGQKATLKWSAVTGATGYQVYYSTNNSDYKKAVSTTSKSASKTFSKSAKGKKIYFKVRAYKKVNGKTIYGNWSAVKSKVIK